MNGQSGNDGKTRESLDGNADGPERNADVVERKAAEVEKKLNLVLIQIAAIQDRIWDCLETLRSESRLSPELEEFARKVMKESSYWVDQCTSTSRSPPILLRRLEIQLERLARVLDLIERT